MPDITPTSISGQNLRHRWISFAVLSHALRSGGVRTKKPATCGCSISSISLSQKRFLKRAHRARMAIIRPISHRKRPDRLAPRGVYALLNFGVHYE